MSVIQIQMNTAKQSDVLQSNLTKYKLLYSAHLFFMQIQGSAEIPDDLATQL
jgi:membrane-bound lytic murein transglycosylase